MKTISLPGSVLKNAKLNKALPSKKFAKLTVFGEAQRTKALALIKRQGPGWQTPQLLKGDKEAYHFVSRKGPEWVLARKKRQGPVSHGGLLEESVYGWHRDQLGSVISLMKAYQTSDLVIEFVETSKDQELGVLVGLEIAHYNFKSVWNEEKPTVQIHLKKSKDLGIKDVIQEASHRGQAINLARHLVNLPANVVNPVSVAELSEGLFKKSKNVELTVWSEAQLKKEKMNLMLAVGQGSPTPPRLVHIRYRPTGAKNKPFALVGKGVTFDTGGLDIKPSSGMRLMKKDMGGSASVLGVTFYLIESKSPVAFDTYLALAENSVDGNSFRPGDIIQARNGLQIEIHNTDAEGRLVLADALDVAVTQSGKNEPQAVIDVATLTGACRVALGAEIGGLFGNADELTRKIQEMSQKAGDLLWQLPLYGRYAAGMASPFADAVNAVDGFAGPITAALFLEKFVKQKPWIHLDCYCWSDKGGGAMTSSGGNGQAVQTLIEFFKSQEI